MRFSDVLVLVRDTFAPVTAAPDASVTVPEIEPYVDCAFRYAHDNDQKIPADNTLARKRRDDMVSPMS